VELFNSPANWEGKFIACSGDHAEPQHYVDLLAKKEGKPIRLNEVPSDVFGTFFPGAKEIAEMLGWFNEYTYYGPHDKDLGKKLFAFFDFETYLKKKKKKFKKLKKKKKKKPL